MIYVIKYGDTLSEIAKKYNITVKALTDANNIPDPDRIYAGNSLFIPGVVGFDWRGYLNKWWNSWTQ